MYHFYLICAFLVLPIMINIIVRDWFLIQDLRDTLLFIRCKGIVLPSAEPIGKSLLEA